jgi:hypothetical protein
VCRPGQIQRIVCPADVDGLVAHASQDFASQRVIVRFTSKTESLNEVTLSQAVLLKVVRHPPGEARQFGCRGEKLPANSLRIPAIVQERSYFVVQVAHNRRPCSPTAEQVVESKEGLRHLADRIDIGTANLPCWPGWESDRSWWGS